MRRFLYSFLSDLLKVPSDWTATTEVSAFVARVFFFAVGLIIILSSLFAGKSNGMTATASHILVRSEEDCTKLKKEIGDDMTRFSEVAKKHSVCGSSFNGGALGKFGRGQMVEAFDEQAKYLLR